MRRFAILLGSFLTLAALALAQPGDFQTAPTNNFGDDNNLILRSFPIERVITYQGILKGTSGNPVPDGTYNLVFRIYDAPNLGIMVWNTAAMPVATHNGYFSVQIGPLPIAFDKPYYISVQIEGDLEMQRLRMTSAPYSLSADTANYAFKADTAQYVVGGTSNWHVDNSIIYTNGYWGIARGNTSNNLYGAAAQSHTNLGSASKTGTDGYNYPYCTVAGGVNNSASASYSTVSGGQQNSASGNYGTVAGGRTDSVRAIYGGVLSGYSNIAGDAPEDTAAFVGGGYDNTLYAKFSTIGGGSGNSAFYDGCFIGGGYSNTAMGSYDVIGGGASNSTHGHGATVGGGESNYASVDGATVGGGEGDTASHYFATVGGGESNKARGYGATIGGGLGNEALGQIAMVGGGEFNVAFDDGCTIGGGALIHAHAPFSGVASGHINHAGMSGVDTAAFVGGGDSNSARAKYSAVVGGSHNSATGEHGFIGGGNQNRSEEYAVVSGGNQNYASGNTSTVGGGWADTASAWFSTIGGGMHNIVSGNSGTLAGGENNVVSGTWGTIGGGQADTVRAIYGGVASGQSNLAGDAVEDTGAFVGGGCHNLSIAGFSAVNGGVNNTASGYASVICGGRRNSSQGWCSTILGGSDDTIVYGGGTSLVFGRGVYADNAQRVTFFKGAIYGWFNLNRDSRDGQFNYPIQVGTNSSNGNGAYLTSGGVWTNGSSRTFKENFTPFNGSELLGKISNLSVTTWNYKNSAEKHIGPVAEEFVGAFDTGVIRESDGKRDDQYLAAGDVAGVALAGVQELLKQNRELKKMINDLKLEIIELKAK